MLVNPPRKNIKDEQAHAMGVASGSSTRANPRTAADRGGGRPSGQGIHPQTPGASKLQPLPKHRKLGALVAGDLACPNAEEPGPPF